MSFESSDKNQNEIEEDWDSADRKNEIVFDGQNLDEKLIRKIIFIYS